MWCIDLTTKFALKQVFKLRAWNYCKLYLIKTPLYQLAPT